MIAGAYTMMTIVQRVRMYRLGAADREGYIYIYPTDSPRVQCETTCANPLIHAPSRPSLRPQFDRTVLVLSRGAARVRHCEVLLASLLLILVLACLLLFPLFLVWPPPSGEHRALLFALFSLLILICLICLATRSRPSISALRGNY